MNDIFSTLLCPRGYDKLCLNYIPWNNRQMTNEKQCHYEWKTDGSPAIICYTKCGMKKYDSGFGWKEIQ